MRKLRSLLRHSFRPVVVVLGIALLAHLVFRTGPQTVWKQAQAVGWGLALIIVLGGVAHVIKTWAWRLTFRCDLGRLSWSRSLAMRLVSEAIAQLGIAGKVLGEGVRVTLLGRAVPVALGISSGVLDSGLYIIASAAVTVLGIAMALLVTPMHGKFRIYAMLFGGGTVIFIAMVCLAVVKRWPLISKPTRAVGRLPWFRNWIKSKEGVIISAEDSLLSFHEQAPGAFWASLTLNFVCHALAALEVYLVLRFMGLRIAPFGAVVLEGLTKLINTVGALNPGNVGTYEAGNMIITKLFGITAASGLTLALCRRARGIFWAAVGVLCLILMKRGTPEQDIDSQSNASWHGEKKVREVPVSTPLNNNDSQSAIIFANCDPQPARYLSSLARVGSLPVLLRTILTLRGTGVGRIVVCVPFGSVQRFQSALARTRRLPPFVEWREIGAETNVSAMIAEVAATSANVMLLFGDRIYQPRLLQSASEWKGAGSLVMFTNNELAGVYVLSHSSAVGLGWDADSPIESLPQLPGTRHTRAIEKREVPGNSWHIIVTRDDLPAAERKLDSWLVKPTDGLFARMNRKVSIPISRQLIKLPITPNMVTLFVLGVSFTSGVFFAHGGYWSTLLGAALSVAASVLDGSDGEVARLKLQSTKFGCWLETVCDYLYYLFIFGGMSLGLSRSLENKTYLAWGGVLCFGAIMSFLAVSYTRQRLSGAQPEKFLSVWQKKADARSNNPLLFLGRHTEFIIRRCFFPYALFFFALIGMTRFVFIGTALGANIVWMIALYSVITFSRTTSASRPMPNSAALLRQATE